MYIRVFSTGRVRPKRGERGVRRYLFDVWREETLPVNVFLVEHPRGLCLVDAGQTAAAATPGYFPGWYPFFRLARFELGSDDEAASQLASAGIDVKDVRWVVVTHMHTDHVGGIGAFATAEVLVSRTEWDRAQGLGGRLRGYLPQYWPPTVRPRVLEFDGPPVGPFEGSHDVAGDGTLLVVPLPGHTPGHAAVLVRVDPTRPYLCAGDAAPDAAGLATAAAHVAEWCHREGVVVLMTHDDSAEELLAGGARTARTSR